jgi:hypothetical protein
MAQQQVNIGNYLADFRPPGDAVDYMPPVGNEADAQQLLIEQQKKEAYAWLQELTTDGREFVIESPDRNVYIIKLPYLADINAIDNDTSVAPSNVTNTRYIWFPLEYVNEGTREINWAAYANEHMFDFFCFYSGSFNTSHVAQRSCAKHSTCESVRACINAAGSIMRYIMLSVKLAISKKQQKSNKRRRVTEIDLVQTYPLKLFPTYLCKKATFLNCAYVEMLEQQTRAHIYKFILSVSILAGQLKPVNFLGDFQLGNWTVPLEDIFHKVSRRWDVLSAYANSLNILALATSNCDNRNDETLGELEANNFDIEYYAQEDFMNMVLDLPQEIFSYLKDKMITTSMASINKWLEINSLSIEAYKYARVVELSLVAFGANAHEYVNASNRHPDHDQVEVSEWYWLFYKKHFSTNYLKSLHQSLANLFPTHNPVSADNNQQLVMVHEEQFQFEGIREMHVTCTTESVADDTCHYEGSLLLQEEDLLTVKVKEFVQNVLVRRALFKTFVFDHIGGHLRLTYSVIGMNKESVYECAREARLF